MLKEVVSYSLIILATAAVAIRTQTLYVTWLNHKTERVHTFIPMSDLLLASVSWLYDLSMGLRLGEGLGLQSPALDWGAGIELEGVEAILTCEDVTVVPPSEFSVRRLCERRYNGKVMCS